jgi:predicted enzyme related to lactoylglutathione lyase
LEDFYSSLFGWHFEEGQRRGYYLIKNAGNGESTNAKRKPTTIVGTGC